MLCLLTAYGSWTIAPAYAYLDPGTGSIILQSLIGCIAAAGAFGSIYYQRIKKGILKFRSRAKVNYKNDIK